MSSFDLSGSMNKSSTSIIDVRSSCSLPLDYLKDVEIFEERISVDGTFNLSLVRNYNIV